MTASGEGMTEYPGVRCQTSGVAALPVEAQRAAVRALVSFDGFNPGDDPYGEHDFGAFELPGVGRLFFKIDYYADERMKQGVERPETGCYRCLVLMKAEEY